MPSAKDNNPSVIEQRAEPAGTVEPTPGSNEGYMDSVKNQINSTETGNSLADLGNNASAMIGESFNEVKNRVSSISPGEVVDGVRERIQSMTNGNGNGGDAESEHAAKQEAENAPSHEEIQIIEDMESEKIAEFLQEKHMSNANLRRGK
ncbi:uncharacterized protein ACHE_70782S [Aspergillus chevalieri]|uniref:Uncharacterized protein n=1 Tax=Aspergillus chevalieri TaxID=182096 RepID=A0A7R7ZSQ9_ASPCH|nr:uncharacterized protein ACHE_70782S [Aspergillus chevalieri]BCR91939.1 hypothetical protein ACHE_70782S [Aspergillus chevalieri]